MSMDAKTLEKYSSAFTLSDMEVYIFPELLYSLVLANLMSPRIWAWKHDPWFAGLAGAGFGRRLQRLKQYIMDHYTFNLDLETWGLTTKRAELARFTGLVSAESLGRSNALFGYEGDKYYFDIDIRRHFGLDQYDGEVIPYWKTETVEAMDAFRFKPGHAVGAGECVSLSALYAAALYIVLDVPLEDIFILATPLHSQNFIAHGEGVLTNNRRLVTKNMWFNGTALSEKARRALAKERVTIVSHLSGHVHIDDPEATLPPETYRRFTEALARFLTARVDFEIFVNFLRVHPEDQRHFQFEYPLEGRPGYLAAEKLFAYEATSKFRLGDATQDKLLAEIEREEFDAQPIPDRVVLNAVKQQLNGHPLDCRSRETCTKLRAWLALLPEAEAICARLRAFSCIEPRLPAADKHYVEAPRLRIPVGWDSSQVIGYLRAQRSSSVVADLAFYAGRQLDERGWPPFLKACLERNPVCRIYFGQRPPADIHRELNAWPAESIYDGAGLATPDEVVNFRRGDGLEKALCLAAVLTARGAAPRLTTDGRESRVEADGNAYIFPTRKSYDLQYVLDPAAFQFLPK